MDRQQTWVRCYPWNFGGFWTTLAWPSRVNEIVLRNPKKVADVSRRLGSDPGIPLCFQPSGTTKESCGRGLHSTEVVNLLLTQQTRTRFPAFPKFGAVAEGNQQSWREELCTVAWKCWLNPSSSLGGGKPVLLQKKLWKVTSSNYRRQRSLLGSYDVCRCGSWFPGPWEGPYWRWWPWLCRARAEKTKSIQSIPDCKAQPNSG